MKKVTTLLILGSLFTGCAAMEEINQNQKRARAQSVSKVETEVAAIKGTRKVSNGQGKWVYPVTAKATKDNFYLKAKIFLSKYRAASAQALAVDDKDSGVVAAKVDDILCESPKGFAGDWRANFVLVAEYNEGHHSLSFSNITHRHPNPNNVFLANSGSYPRNDGDLDDLIRTCLSKVANSFENDLPN